MYTAECISTIIRHSPKCCFKENTCPTHFPPLVSHYRNNWVLFSYNYHCSFGAKKHYYSLKVNRYLRSIYPFSFPALLGSFLFCKNLMDMERKQATHTQLHWTERQHSPLSCPLPDNCEGYHSIRLTHLVPLQPQVSKWLYVWRLFHWWIQFESHGPQPTKTHNQ